MIYVRTKKDRVAYEEYLGRRIPHDEYVGVKLTPHIARLLNVHKDIELRPDEPSANAASAPEPEAVATSERAVKKEK
jgi:hypothetical protein